MKRFAFRIMGIAAMPLIVTSCASNIVEVHKGDIVGYGGTQHPPLRTKDLIVELDVGLRNIASEDKTNLWLEFADGEKMTFAAINALQLRRHGALESTNTSSTQTTYSKDGYKFIFDGPTPIQLMILQYGWPVRSTNVFSRVGSFSSNQTLTVPCTLKQFETVFGKPDLIDRE